MLASAARSDIHLVGVFANQRNPSVPDAPTVREQGYAVAPFSPGGLSLPAGTPEPIRAKYEAACAAAAKTEKVAQLMKTVHQPLDYYADGATYTRTLEQDLETKRRLLGQLGMLKKE